MAPTCENVGNNIPDDLILEILYKLPLKSLKRFRCVCKTWADDLFESPQFMAVHHKNLLLSSCDTDNSSILLKQTSYVSYTSYISYRDNLFLLFGKRLENKVKIDFPIFDININILGSFVNGTLCLYQGTTFDRNVNIPFKVVLWNSTTKEFKVVRPGIVRVPRDLSIRIDLPGFGYDTVTNDYKLIRYIRFFNKNCSEEGLSSIRPKPLLQIYSLRSNSWRDLDVEMPTHDCHNQVYLNGVCHWLSYKLSNREELVLVSFNLSDEVLHTTPLDCRDCFAYADWNRSALVVLNDSIAMITGTPCTNLFDISILGAIGVKESWTKLFRIGPLFYDCVPIGVWKKGFIFNRMISGQLAYFNLSTQVIGLEEIDIGRDGSQSQIVICKESIGAMQDFNITPLIAKGLALRCGLKLFAEKGLTNLVFNSDSLNLCNAFNHDHVFGDLMPIVHDCKASS
ncbi:hypothetical protein RIF29_24301 [Crotalaria pallida]|uniref:F-box domain-containing protein n=1 Tax=Crotalaria pallida TaxID=3830 RepID=A0AAN9EJJ0_CROPI